MVSRLLELDCREGGGKSEALEQLLPLLTDIEGVGCKHLGAAKRFGDVKEQAVLDGS
ncbi:hypothetical protein SDC9_92685 [bioreactor metagenome]|uniref:Uncharacterized protein n=1 Tax=bioreactor metagenome TaxID=1076179 RepID=A0A645A180_9ZZZZ